MDTSLLTTTEICRATGASYRNVDYWTRIGVLDPAVDADGSGTRRLYHPREAQVAAAVLLFSQIVGPTDMARFVTGLARHVRAHALTGTVRAGPLTFDCARVRDPLGDLDLPLAV